jgi:hypothetical protein
MEDWMEGRMEEWKGRGLGADRVEGWKNEGYVFHSFNLPLDRKPEGK